MLFPFTTYHALLDAVGDGIADLLLVLVDEGAVEVTVAGLQSGADGSVHRTIGGGLPGAQTDDGHCFAVVQRVSGNGLRVDHG